MKYYIDVVKTDKNNAAKKAPADIAKICDSMGYKRIDMPAIPYNKSIWFQRFWMMTVWLISLLRVKLTIREGDILLYQHPMYGTKLIKRLLFDLKRKNVYLVALIHDLNILRRSSEIKNTTANSVDVQDKVILKMFDRVIVHNDRMKGVLIDQGFEAGSLISLEIFDYLIDDDCISDSSDKGSFVIAGNLLPEKSGYIYRLAEYINDTKCVTLHLFGNGLDSQADCESSRVIYHGSASPSELPKLMKSQFGIVWDGPDIDTCSGPTGEYLKYNNPHKTSLYIASGIPVVIWKGSALAGFVEKNNLGISINSLREVNDIPLMVSDSEYRRMKENAIEFSKLLREGFFFIKAVNRAIEGRMI